VRALTKQFLTQLRAKVLQQHCTLEHTTNEFAARHIL
jgi:hypothetical protein